jgi:type II secretory pathway pseudopilin PulG
VKGYTLLEAILCVLLIGMLTAVAMPRFADWAGVSKAAAVDQWNESARAALYLDFARQQVTTGQYASPFRGREGRPMTGRDRRALEQMLDLPLPTQGQWVLVNNGGATEMARVQYTW